MPRDYNLDLIRRLAAGASIDRELADLYQDESDSYADLGQRHFQHRRNIFLTFCSILIGASALLFLFSDDVQIPRFCLYGCLLLVICFNCIAIPFTRLLVSKDQLIRAFWQHFVSIAITIFSFAGIYHRLGVYGHDTGPHIDPETVLYYSTVTWTTLGYGDLHPEDFCRLFAAIQALMGYIQMGVLVALLFRFIQTPVIRTSSQLLRQLIPQRPPDLPP